MKYKTSYLLALVCFISLFSFAGQTSTHCNLSCPSKDKGPVKPVMKTVAETATNISPVGRLLL